MYTLIYIISGIYKWYFVNQSLDFVLVSVLGYILKYIMKFIPGKRSCGLMGKIITI